MRATPKTSSPNKKAGVYQSIALSLELLGVNLEVAHPRGLGDPRRCSPERDGLASWGPS